MAEVLTMFITEIGKWVGWLNSWTLYGIPFLYYIMGFAVLGLLMDYIFG